MRQNIANDVLKKKEISYGQVELRDNRLLQSRELEFKYLSSLDADKLLAGFVETAGHPKKAERYAGWENTEIQGHTLGHFLTALSQGYADTKQEEFLKILDYTVEELARCQGADGYLFASPSEFFDKVENKQPIWVPWYTMHKVLAGIIAVYKYTHNQTAYEVMSKLGDWIYNRAIAWSQELQKVVLSVEYGGMNDCLYDLYIATGDDKYEKAAHQFDELPLFQALYEKKDVLNGLHANTTIPKVLGALKRYIALGEGEEFYLQVAENFWDIVINHHTYITGGNSEWEHFGAPDILDAERTACNCETCNTYNMLKLSKLLFQITGSSKYADYYEKTFINAVLSSQNPETGMTMYFQPMATGFFKVYSSPYDRFWCCTGSGMENFTKLAEGIYFCEENTFFINRFVESKVTWEEKNIIFDTKANFLTSDKIEITVNFSKNASEIMDKATEDEVLGVGKTFDLAIRRPDWQHKSETIVVNGESVQYKIQNGYVIIHREWNENDKVVINFPMDLRVHDLPDNANVVAFTYGPFVLSAGLGKEKLDTTVTGVNVSVPTKEMTIEDYIILDETEAEIWKENITDYLIKDEKEFSFRLNQGIEDRQLVFTPHFARYDDRYGIYWKLYTKGSEELKQYKEKTDHKMDLENVLIDIIPIGNDQYELAHEIRGEKTDAAGVMGHRCRFAKEDGWFSYRMKVEEGNQVLCTTYCSKDEEDEFDIYINDSILVHVKVARDDNHDFYMKEYEIPSELLSGNNTVIVKFHSSSSQSTCRIYDELYIRRQ